MLSRILQRLRRRLALRRALVGLAAAWPDGLEGCRIHADGRLLDPLPAHRRLQAAQALETPLAALRDALPGASDHVLLLEAQGHLHLFAAQDAGLEEDLLRVALQLAAFVDVLERGPPVPPAVLDRCARRIRLPRRRRASPAGA